MSLQVWLPLNGDIRNRGLGTVTKDSGTSNFNKEGKIGGKALNLKQKNVFVCPQLVYLKTFSVAFWAMVEASSSITDNWTDVFGFESESSSGAAGYFRWETCYSYTAPGIHWHDNPVYALTTGAASHNKAKGEWVHCCVVFDAVAEKVYSYSNGVLDYTSPHTGGRFNKWGAFNIGEENALEGRIQDVRIYDHALSSREVKEISKGLCLHYKLSEQGTPNLIKNALRPIHTYRDYTGKASTKWLDKNGTVSDIYAVTFPVDSETYTNYNFYAAFSRDALAVQNDGKTYTLSFKIKSSKTLSQYTIYYEYINKQIQVDIGTEWRTVTMTGTANYSYSAFYLCFNSTDRKKINGGTLYIADLKLGLGSVATPWVPHVDDALYKTLGFNSNIEPDCSGYGNDGIKIGTTAIQSSDSPRYLTCRENIDKTSYINAGKGAKITDEVTISCWGYLADWSKYNAMRLFSCTEAGGWNLESSGTKFNFPVYVSGIGYINCYSATDYASLSSGWHHFVCTYDGLESKIYIDGKLDNSKSNGKTVKTPIQYNTTNSIFIGAEATSSADTAETSICFVGRISDFRIYATALSASNVAELYSTSATIDSTGNGYTYELVEED